MKPFLYRVAEVIKENYPTSPENICIVLPNRRSGLFLRKYLSEVYRKVFWAPDIYAIGDFIAEVSDSTIVEPALLLTDLYKACVKADKETGVDNFLTYGQKVLSDFNQVDLYLVNPEALFLYLDQAKALSIWNLDKKPLTSLQKNYIRFFNNLYKIYTVFKSDLSARNLAYQGMAYRNVAENTEKLIAGMKWDRVIFAGFNALSKAELKLITTLLDAGKADIIWNTDTYYTDNNIQEAGHFFRQNFNHIKQDNIRWKDNQLNFTAKNIMTLGASGNFAQVVAMNQVLKQWFNEGKDPDDTVVVLNDESLLFPVLSFMGNLAGDYNITMGIPLKTSPAFKFSEALFVMYENSAYYTSAGKRSKNVFHYKDILRLFETSVLRRLLSSFTFDNDYTVSEELVKTNKVFYSKYELIALLHKFDPALEKPGNMIFHDGNCTIHTVIEVIENIYQAIFSDKSPINQSGENRVHSPFIHASLELLVTATSKLKKSLEGMPEIDDLKLTHRLFNSMSENLMISLFGEPLKGMQVMGMLETRTIDFKNVVMLSVNEGLMPKTNLPDSFIPFDISIEFGLPTYKERDAIYAYHFYRLLQYAENITLIYNTETGILGSNEKSRYILQLEHELVRTNPSISYSKQVYSPEISNKYIQDEFIITKTSPILQKIKELAFRGFSPSSLIKYKNCSLQFYFQYIAGLEEADEVTETVDQAMFGTIIHEVLKNIYESFEKQFITADMLKAAIKKSGETIKEIIKKVFPSDDFVSGKNYLISEVIHNYIERYLSYELHEVINKNHKLRVLFLENKLKALLKTAKDDSTSDFPVYIRGICDRIDEFDGVVRILDYKTGSVHASDLRVKDMADIVKASRFDKAFQVLIYRWLFTNDPAFDIYSNEIISTGILPLKNISEGYLELEFREDPSQIKQFSFEIMLKEMVAEMLNADIPFIQTLDRVNCRNCPYKVICNRINTY